MFRCPDHSRPVNGCCVPRTPLARQRAPGTSEALTSRGVNGANGHRKAARRRGVCATVLMGCCESVTLLHTTARIICLYYVHVRVQE